MTRHVVIVASILVALAACRPSLAAQEPSPSSRPSQPVAIGLHFEETKLTDGGVPITVQAAWRAVPLKSRPAILMLGSLKEHELPEWSTGLVSEGYMLVAFAAQYPPDPDPARRPQWLVFDRRFAHSYVIGGYRAARDAKRVVEYLVSRGDVDPTKIGWLGSSSTAIPGLAVITQGPRLAAIVAFVSTGAYRQWLETWHTNGLWRGATKELWPETEEYLKYDPILFATNAYPTAILMVSGGNDKVVDPATARAFVAAARPAYEKDEERLQLVIYDGFGHNLPRSVIRTYAEHWFHLYMHPTEPPPPVASQPAELGESVKRTQINAADHKDVVGAK